MTGYALRRLGVGVLQLAAITVLVFVVMRFLPADPVGRLVGFTASPETIALTRDKLDLDESLPDQLLIYLGLREGDQSPGLLQGSLGDSWNTGAPVVDQIAQYLPVTLELIILAFVAALLVAVPLGVLAAVRGSGRLDAGIRFYGLFAGAQPEFWWGLAFIFLFYVTWQVAPAPLGRLDFLTAPPPRVTGMLTVDSLLAGNLAAFRDAAAHLVLPVVTLAFVLTGPIIKMVRQNVAKAMASEYVLYARGCGLPTRQIAAYTFRNSLAPSVTLIAILFAYMLGGAVLVEQVFSLGGLGQWAVASVLSFDFPAIQGIVLVITVGTLLVLLAVDLLHARIDPRVAR
ncbi:MAG: ABC transporter permease [Chloroflexi bacterium]|nr:ABC transporter permease [Chloroflexota bacterium]